MAGFDLGNQQEDAFSPMETQEMMRPQEDAAQAAFDLSWEDTPVGAIARLLANREAEQAGGTKLQPADLNEKYPMPEKFNEPMTDRMAQMLYSRYENRNRLSEAIQTGSNTFTEKIVNGAAGLLPHFMDPLNVGSALLTGGVANALTKGAELGVAARYGVAVGENLIGNAMWQPLVASANRAEGREYGAADIFQNVIAPSVIFPAIHMGGTHAFKYLAKLNTPGAESANRAVIGALSEGRDPNITINTLKRQTVMETQGTGFAKYTHEPLSVERPFYAASRSAGGTLSTAEKALIGEDFGGGVVTLSDNPNVANGSAARAGYEAPGTVHQVDLSRAKILQLTEEEIQKAAAQDGGLEALRARAQAEGYDGLSYTQTKVMGEDHAPHNVVAVFNPEVMAESGQMRANPDHVPKLSEDELSTLAQRQLDPKARLEDSAFIEDIKGYQEIDDVASKNVIEREKPSEISSQSAELSEQLKSLQEMGHLDGDDARELKMIGEMEQKTAKIRQIVKDALNC